MEKGYGTRTWVSRSPVCGVARAARLLTAGVLAVREHTRRAVLRYGRAGGGRRSGAAFGARTGTTSGTHSTRLSSALPNAVRLTLTASRACSC